MKKTKVSYVGTRTTTFSGEAYWEMVRMFGGPPDCESEEVSVSANPEVLPHVIGHGGRGAIAMETRAEGRIDGPVICFLQLLRSFKTTSDCPIGILGGYEKPLNFAFMTRPGVRRENVNAILGHIKSKGACGNFVRASGVRFIEAENNGQAAKDVATKPEYERAAALGLITAADEYGLKVHEKDCADKPAATTFFLLCPRTERVNIGEVNRFLLVFRVSNESGSLVEVLLPFRKARINLLQIHSCYVGEKQYDFVIEGECTRNEINAHTKAMEDAIPHTERHILFGPFPVV